MTYTLKSKFGDYDRKEFGKKILIVLLFATVSIFVFIGLGKILAGFLSDILAPVVKFRTEVYSSLGRGLNFFAPKATLIEENEKLKEELFALRAELNNLSVNLEVESSNNFITSFPLSFPPTMPYDTILINVGQKKSVREGAKVFLPSNIEIGVIESTFENNSRVRLFSSAGIKTEAILAATGAVIELVGQGGGNFKAELPLSFDVEEGDVFILPGEERSVLAEVKSVKKDEASSFVYLLLALPVPINGNSILYVEP